MPQHSHFLVVLVVVQQANENATLPFDGAIEVRCKDL
jgi:hypothetical protein